MKSSDILIAKKMTKIEWDMRRLNLDENELKKFYEREGLHAENIFTSHQRQHKALKELTQMLPEAKVIDRDSINREIVKNFKLIIAFGGDNHFQHVSHFVDKQLILGINSDPNKSVGALCSVTSADIPQIVDDLLEEKFKVEKWTRTRISLDGKAIWPDSVSDVFIGEEKRYTMSRHLISKENIAEEQRGSGLILCTGAGSTGWYLSASKYLQLKKHKFEATDEEIWFLLTEPYEYSGLKYNLNTGSIKKGEHLDITSLSDSQAIISIDSLIITKIREGAKIKVEIGAPLNTVKLK